MPSIYLPAVHAKPLQNAADWCGMNEGARDAFVLWRDHVLQKRPVLRCDERLARVAQAQAEELRAREYRGVIQGSYDLHLDDEGRTPNQRIREAGYALPDWYGNANTCESIGVWHKGPVEAIMRLLASPAHWPHMSGDNGFYAMQSVGGVGYAEPAWWVFVSAPPEEEELP